MKRLAAARPCLLVLACALTELGTVGCAALAGYGEVEPWIPDAGAESAEDAPDDSSVDVSSIDESPDVSEGKVDPLEASDAPPEGDAPNEVVDAPPDVDAGPCPILVGNDACATVPHFRASTQVVDGIGNEFCDIPAMVFSVNDCPMKIFPPPGPPPTMPEMVYLRVAWSKDAFHLHVHVVDPSVNVNPVQSSIWNGDAIELFIAGTDTLTGSYDSGKDGGAIQIALSPPAGGFITRGNAYWNPANMLQADAPINMSTYAGRLVDDGYELELRLPWTAFANTIGPGGKMGFDIAVDAQGDADAGGRQLQCIMSDSQVGGAHFSDASLSCNGLMGAAAEPYCDDRTWCLPTLLE